MRKHTAEEIADVFSRQAAGLALPLLGRGSLFKWAASLPIYLPDPMWLLGTEISSHAIMQIIIVSQITIINS